MSMIEQEQYEEAAAESEYEKPDSDFQADFTLEDTQVPQHPVVVDVPGHGKASAHLVQWSTVEDMQGDAEEYGMESDLVAKVLRDHYVSPSFDGLTGDKVGSMKMSSPDALLGAIMPGMEANMNPDGSAQVTAKNA